MKGLILAGGRGTRLFPLTENLNKHLLPVGGEPMIWHSVKQLTSAGLRNIMVVTSTDHMGDIVNSLGSGARFGCDLTYRVQEKPGGIAEAVSMAEQFASGSKIVVMLGDNIFERTIAPYVEAFRKQPEGARVLLTKVGDPERFGIASLDEHHVISIEEKPAVPRTNYAVVGLYMYDHQVFDLIRQTNPSARDELEITAVNNLYIEKKQLSYSMVEGRWMDAGTFESLLEAGAILLKNNNYILQ